VRLAEPGSIQAKKRSTSQLAAVPYLLFKQNSAQGSRRAIAQLLALALGGAVGSVPTIYFAFTAFDNFIYANFNRNCSR